MNRVFTLCLAVTGSVTLAGVAYAADPAKDGAKRYRTAANVPAAQPRSANPAYETTPLLLPGASLGRGGARGAYTAAPMPNDDVSAPVDRTPPHVSGGPTMFPIATQYQGDGYTYGSTRQGIDDKKDYGVPGVDVNYPLR